MASTRVKSYSVSHFFDDVERHFKFLVDSYGFEETSSQWTSHRDDSVFGEHVATAVPQVTYQATLRHISIRHDRGGAVRVVVTRMYPDLRSATVEEIARETGTTNPSSFREEYDMTLATALDRIAKLAEGLRAYGEDWLIEPTPP
jgi:hypothetical protein